MRLDFPRIAIPRERTQLVRSRPAKQPVKRARRGLSQLPDGGALDEGREVAQDPDGGIAQLLIVLEMAADKSELRTELARLPARHSPANPEGLRFVRSRKHNPTANRDGLTAQRRVEHLLDR